MAKTETLVLPELGEDWLKGYRNTYIILSLKHSTPEFSMFWAPGDCGYTCNLIEAGKYARGIIQRKPFYYNDGINSVAVPLTHTALDILGLGTVLVEYTLIERLLSNRIVQKP